MSRALVVDFDLLYVPSPLDDVSKRMLAGTMRVGFLEWAEQIGEHFDIHLHGEVSDVPGGVELVADWLRTQITKKEWRGRLDVTLPSGLAGALPVPPDALYLRSSLHSSRGTFVWPLLEILQQPKLLEIVWP